MMTPWNDALLLINEYAMHVNDATSHEAASRADVAHSAALKTLTKLRELWEAAAPQPQPAQASAQVGAKVLEALSEARDVIAVDRKSLAECHQVRGAQADEPIAHGLVLVDEGVWLSPGDAALLEDYDAALAKIDAAIAAAEAQAARPAREGQG